MKKYAGWLDSFWCGVFTLSSLGGWLWLYWDMADAAQKLL